jgi:ABC-2 type transport system permease protein/oleandomycin transport system permease protein
MTTAVMSIPSADVQRRSPAVAAVRDSSSIAWRNLITYRRVPQLLVFSTIQPVIFVLLFRYVFGGAITIPGKVPYVDYLMPGIFAQTVVFGAIGSAIGLATDLKSGLLERFRTLPMSRAAVLAGRTLADLLRNVFVIALMVVVGVMVGFRVHTSPPEVFAGLLVVLLFSYAMSWVFALVGLAVGDPETAQAAAFPVLAPLVFASAAFVPVTSMPTWLQGFALHQPVSAVIAAMRDLMGSAPPGSSTGSDVVQALAWCVGILVVFAPLAVWRYRRT